MFSGCLEAAAAAFAAAVTGVFDTSAQRTRVNNETAKMTRLLLTMLFVPLFPPEASIVLRLAPFDQQLNRHHSKTVNNAERTGPEEHQFPRNRLCLKVS